MRRSVVGLSFDYAALNLVGFLCYSAFNVALYYSPAIQEDYKHDNHGHSSAVRVNDVFFALHAAFMSAVVLAPRQRPPPFESPNVWLASIWCDLSASTWRLPRLILRRLVSEP